MADREFIEGVGIPPRQICHRSLCLKDMVDHLQRDLAGSRDLVSANRRQAKVGGGARDNKVEDAVRSAADLASVFSDRADEEALVLKRGHGVRHH
jgi:hypothetical protein